MYRHLPFTFILILAFLLCQSYPAAAQKIQDGSYRTVAYVRSDGSIQDGSVQDSSYRVIGYAKDIPMQWTALYFFFQL